MVPSMAPTSWHVADNRVWSGEDKQPQSLAKSSQVSVSEFSPSESDSLLTKCASYFRLDQASRRLAQTDREERRTLVCQGILFLRWPSFAQVVDFHRELVGFLIGDQVFRRFNLHFMARGLEAEARDRGQRSEVRGQRPKSETLRAGRFASPFALGRRSTKFCELPDYELTASALAPSV